MNTESKEFMITEYDKISSAYFGLRDQVNEWFKAYLTLVGLPLTILAAVIKIAEGSLSASIINLPDIVAGLLILVSLLGLFVTISIISMRMEMILYARTINCVRRFFANSDNTLVQFLVLPTSDAMPPFYESWRAMFWQVLMIGFMDGMILGVGILSLIHLGILVSILVAILFWLIHWLVYRIMALTREDKWKTTLHFPENLNKTEI
jgi:hypothetical protein